MEEHYCNRSIFPLTSLQIGDLQSYLSSLSIFLATESEKFYILVDNRPWLQDLGSRSAHLWQLMVTKSRLSPFANTRAKSKSKTSSISNKNEPRKAWRVSTFIKAAIFSRKKLLIPVKNLRKTLIFNSELGRTLYGFIVFEIAWGNVRGINYLNELQNDTSLAIEAKFMRRCEFESISQASYFLSWWFSGTIYEEVILKDYLEGVTGDVFYDSSEYLPIPDYFSDADDIIYSDDRNMEFHSPVLVPKEGFEIMQDKPSSPVTPPFSTIPYKRRTVMVSDGIETDCTPFSSTASTSIDGGSNEDLKNIYSENYKDGIEGTQYMDVLLLIRFNDRDLPFKLRQIVISDLRLLRLLESGLPPWVLFLQSYPVFCRIYRPWMCPLARTLYVLISTITVLIGFYDLYKNVPVLKATVSRLCGPLVDWIDTWEMASRIKYLGTMLVLHNFQKAVKWTISVANTLRSFLSLLTEPIAGPFLELVNNIMPLWNVCIQLVDDSSSFLWTIMGPFLAFLENLAICLLWPIWFFVSVIWKLVFSVICPLLAVLWEILYAPIRLFHAIFSFLFYIYIFVSEFLVELWVSTSTLFQFASSSHGVVDASEISIWRSVWNDLFSQVFRAIRSILNGFVAFFTTCNRHRLSIYNHTLKCIQRLTGRRSDHTTRKDSKLTPRTQTHSEEARR